MKSVLIIEPDVLVGPLMANILSEEGYQIALASSLAEASSRLSVSHFDLIITEALDQGMDLDLDPSFLDELRAIAGDTPIILCSVYISTSASRRLTFDLAGLVPKPFDIDDLLVKIDRILGQAEADSVLAAV